MGILRYLFDPAILIVLITFFSITIYYVRKVNYINFQLLNLLTFLKSFKKYDMGFCFKELDSGMTANPYVSNAWHEFRNTLVFSESVSYKDEKNDVVFQNISQSTSNIQTTVDPIYFFNEESLVTSKLNYKFIQTAPTILTGMGPLFTFLNIVIAFAGVNFSTQEKTLESVAHLIGGMQVAALISVLAVGSSIIFLVLERILYNRKCKAPLNEVQECFFKLFDNISSEKFLIELLKEAKLQNNSITNLLSVLPSQFKDSLDKSLTSLFVPYLDNLIFGINKLQEKIVREPRSDSDVVDNLFKG
jgi:hypothetical protein